MWTLAIAGQLAAIELTKRAGKGREGQPCSRLAGFRELHGVLGRHAGVRLPERDLGADWHAAADGARFQLAALVANTGEHVRAATLVGSSGSLCLREDRASGVMQTTLGVNGQGTSVMRPSGPVPA